MEVLSRQLVMEPMRKIDALFRENYKTSKGNSKNDDVHVESRCLARGFVLHALCKATGTEGIFASPNIIPILVTPTYLIVHGTHVFQARQFVSKVLGNEEEMLAPLLETIQERITPESVAAANNLGEFIHRRILELDAGRPISDDLYSTIDGGGFNSLVAAFTQRAPKNVHARPKVRQEAPQKVTLAMILTENQSYIGLGVVGMMLRDTLNKS